MRTNDPVITSIIEWSKSIFKALGVGSSVNMPWIVLPKSALPFGIKNILTQVHQGKNPDNSASVFWLTLVRIL
jgi:hypothetical protein